MKQMPILAKQNQLLSRFGAIGVFLISLLVVTWRFSSLMPEVFYGDDLDYLLLFKDGGCATEASQILTTACYERFRPVASGFVLAMMHLFQYELSYYLAVNVVLQSLIAALVFAIALRLSRGNWLVALLIALAVAMSRFAAYQVTQMIGPVESLTLALCLGAVYGAVRADESVEGAWKWSWVSIGMVFLAMHSHERSMVAAVWLAMLFVLSPSVRQLGRTRWIALLAACAALPIFYISYKTFVLKAHFLVGTGGTHIKPDPALIFEHGGYAVRSIFGFNSGPDYLIGASVTWGWHAAWLLAAILFASWMALAIRGLRATLPNREAGSFLERFRWPILLLSLTVALLIPTLLTIRLEQRWLLAPFTIVMLASAWAAGTNLGGRSVRIATILVVLLAGASIVLDGKVMRHFDRLFFVSSPRFAESVKHGVVDAHPDASGPVALLATPDQCSWTLARGGFFRIYGGRTRSLSCFTSLESAAKADLPETTKVYSVGSDGQLVDLSSERIALEDTEATTTFDFLQNFDSGRISDKARVATPTGQGALKMPWDSVTGVKETLTVISGFSYTFDNIELNKESELSFGVSMIYPSSSPARFVVLVEPAKGGIPLSFARDLSPPTADDKLDFERISIPLSQFAGMKASIRFGVESPDGNSSGHWIGFSDPRVVTRMP